MSAPPVTRSCWPGNRHRRWPVADRLLGQACGGHEDAFRANRGHRLTMYQLETGDWDSLTPTPRRRRQPLLRQRQRQPRRHHERPLRRVQDRRVRRGPRAAGRCRRRLRVEHRLRLGPQLPRSRPAELALHVRRPADRRPRRRRRQLYDHVRWRHATPLPGSRPRRRARSHETVAFVALAATVVMIPAAAALVPSGSLFGAYVCQQLA